ncbi:MAG: hypothetical protein ACYCTB_06260 [bacterium]
MTPAACIKAKYPQSHSRESGNPVLHTIGILKTISKSGFGLYNTIIK